MVDKDNLSESAAVGVTAVLLVVATCVSLFHLRSFIIHKHYPQAQNLLFCILLMPVLVGWSGWTELLLKQKAVVIDFLISLFASLCLATFFLYVEKLLGWEEKNGRGVYSENKKLESLISTSTPKFLRCIKCRKIQTKKDAKQYLTVVRASIYQCCFVIVGLGILGSIFIISSGNYSDNSDANIIRVLTLIKSISSIGALLSLLNFGIYVNKIPEMASMQLMQKFVIMKLGIFFTEIQPLIIGLFSNNGYIANNSKYSNEEITLYTNSLLLCSEMAIMSFLLVIFYPIDDYSRTAEKKSAIAQEANYIKL